MKCEITRGDLEGLAAHLLSRLDSAARNLLKSLEAQSISLADVSAVEVVGGSTRISAVRNKLAEVFQKELSTTLNLDEVLILFGLKFYFLSCQGCCSWCCSSGSHQLPFIPSP